VIAPPSALFDRLASKETVRPLIVGVKVAVGAVVLAVVDELPWQADNVIEATVATAHIRMDTAALLTTCILRSKSFLRIEDGAMEMAVNPD
jgi:hypothetical protein